MNNPDVLQLILLKCDDQTLDKLVLTSLWPSIREVLQDPHFWYLRTEIVVGRQLKQRPGADWHKIYYLVSANGVGIIDDLPSAEVITEVFGSSFWSDLAGWRGIDKGVTNAQVMKYLLDNNYVKLADIINNAMYLAGTRDLRDLVDYLLGLFVDAEQEEVYNALMHGLSGAIFGDKLDMYQYIEKLIIDNLAGEDLDMDQIIEEIIEGGGPEITAHLVRYYDLDNDNVELLVSESIERGRPDVLAAVLSHLDDAYTSNITLHYFHREIDQAVADGHTTVIEELMKYTLITPEDVLHYGVANDDKHMIKYGLTIVEDPNINLDNIIARSWKSGVIDLVVRDSRVDLERLEGSTIKLLTRALASRIIPALDGFAYGNGLAGGEHVRYLLSSFKNVSTDINSALLKLLVIKRPSGRDIFSWLATSRWPDIVLEGARSIKNKNLRCTARAIPVRELMLAIVYPTMTLKEVNSVLESEGVTREIIILACRLVGTYIGYRDNTEEEDTEEA